MQVLFLTTSVGGASSSHESYLEDSIFIGMRRLLGDDCVDYPKKETLYESCDIPTKDLYGRGFTIWKTLEEISVNRDNAFERLRNGEFDLVVFGNIQWQPDLFHRLRENGLLDVEATQYAFLDGVDYVPKQFVKRHLKRLLMAYQRNVQDVTLNGSQPIVRPIITEALSYGSYFKRELDESYATDYTSANLFQTSFAIPDEKVRDTRPEKTRLFSSQVQCDEAYKIPEVRENSTREYQFWEEENYYDDMAESYFSITQMKGGWDCMRHYEIAANLSVPCFYELSEKPSLCAPHGLRDMYNCLTFQTADELQAKVDYVFEHDLYDFLLENVRDWISENTSSARAKNIISQV